MQGLEELAKAFADLGELRALLARTGLSESDFMTLLAIDRAGSAHAGAVAKTLGYSPAKASRGLGRLVSFGLVSETVDKADRRKLDFRLANNGFDVVFDLERTFGRERMVSAFGLFLRLQHESREAATALDVPVTPTEWGFVATLAAADRPLRVGELSQACCCQQPKTSMALRALVRKGLVSSESGLSPNSGSDCRAHRFSLNACTSSLSLLHQS